MAKLETVLKWAKEAGIEAEKQALRFGFFRVTINVESWETVEKIYRRFTQGRGYTVKDRYIYGPAYSDYHVMIYVTSDYTSLKAAIDADCAKKNDWCQRWHDADEETRRLMSCGAIA